VQERLARHFHASPKANASELRQSLEQIERACERLCRQGKAVFDVQTREFRHRELFGDPIDEAKLFPPDERQERALALVEEKAVRLTTCEPQETRKTKKLKTPDGPVTREIVYRDWQVSGEVGSERTQVVVKDTGRIIFGTCSCAFFQDNLLGKGPCEHMMALFRASSEARRDLPTSTAASAAPCPLV
jgi:hypothetical protein